MRPTTRIRRGKEVEIPEEWRGSVTYYQTVRKRPSKMTNKLRKAIKDHQGRGRDPEARAPKIEEFV